MKGDSSELAGLLAMAPGVQVEQYLDQLAQMSAGTNSLAQLLGVLSEQVMRLEALTPPSSRALAVDIAVLQRQASRRRNHDILDGTVSFSKVDEYGLPLRMASEEWAAVCDQGYHLMWTVNPFLQGDWPHRASRYRWSAVQDALAVLNVQGWCGHRDWRLPSIDELRTLSYTATQSSDFHISRQLFPDVQGDGLFWSSSRDADDAQAVQAWDFVDDGAVSRPLSAFAHVRFVRSTSADA